VHVWSQGGGIAECISYIQLNVMHSGLAIRYNTNSADDRLSNCAETFTA